MSLLTALLLVRAAHAGDDDIQKMLNNIPEIKSQTEAPPPEKPKEADPAVTLETFTAKTRSAILANWKPDAKLVAKKPTLAAKFLVKIGDDGTFADPVMVVSSGNKKFDASAADAIYATAKTDAPPSWLASPVAADGITVEFTAAAAAR
jgi:hypothetical protein